MKRIVVALIVLSLSVGAFAQIPDLAPAFTDLTNALNPALPVNATIGTPWSDAYIGGFPHFGVGLAVGITTIPMDSVGTILTAIKVDPTSIPGMDKVLDFGLPIPAAAVTARMGGFILPFDVGAKIGTIPDQFSDDVASFLPAGSTLNYFLTGADVRFAVMKEGRDFADVSIGFALDYLKGDVSLPLNADPQSFSFTPPSTSDVYTIAMTSPTFFMQWSTIAADLNIQASKRILILTPYLGAGMTFGKPTLSTGLNASATLQVNSGTPTTLTDADLETLKGYYADTSPEYAELDNFSTTGYAFSASETDWLDGMDYRVFGGLSLDILIVRVDLTASYNFVGKNFGATVGTRIQF